jgi:hypothetical protein
VTKRDEEQTCPPRESVSPPFLQPLLDLVLFALDAPLCVVLDGGEHRPAMPTKPVLHSGLGTVRYNAEARYVGGGNGLVIPAYGMLLRSASPVW